MNSDRPVNGILQSLDWHLLKYPVHKGLQELVKELNHFIHQNPPFMKISLTKAV
jgi:1,4-alpha-glucan branching enzyme